MKNRLRLLTAFFVLSFVLTIGGTVFNIGGAGVLKAEAAEGDAGAFSVETTDGDYSYSDGVLTISGGGEYTISMKSGATTPTNDTIKVTADEAVKITLNGVNITSSSAAPIEIAESEAEAESESEDEATAKGDVTIVLKGENTLEATADYRSGIEISTSRNIIIDGGESDELNVTSTSTGENKRGAAIGSDSGDVNIIINGGTINAETEAKFNYGPAIGSYEGAVNITINGGTITADAIATDRSYGAAIGSSNNTANITINGGKINAKSEGKINNGSAIGSYTGTVYITISGGEINAAVEATGEAETDGTNGDNNGSAIGSNTGEANITISGGKITATAKAAADNTGAAIGSRSSDSTTITTINITGGDITAEAFSLSDSNKNNYGAAIGSYNGAANITIDGANTTIEATALANFRNYGAAIGSNSGVVDITIKDGTINATTMSTNENVGSAIGSRAHDGGTDTDKITITGGTITATAKAANDDAESTSTINSGAAIGTAEGVIYINISGGKITATTSAYDDSKGAAIGSSGDTTTAYINISGGTITATTSGATAVTTAKAIEPNKGDAVISPTVNTLIMVKYEEDAKPTEYYYQTNINDEVGGNYFYSYCEKVKYNNAGGNVSITEDSNGDFAVIVSEYGGENARYLESVMLLVNDKNNDVVRNQELKFYEGYSDETSVEAVTLDESEDSDDDSEETVAQSIIFNVDGSSLDSDRYEVICALVKTYFNYDADNSNGDIVYYLSDSLLSSEG